MPDGYSYSNRTRSSVRSELPRYLYADVACTLHYHITLHHMLPLNTGLGPPVKSPREAHIPTADGDAAAAAARSRWLTLACRA
jgi:hypothetical protein